MSQPIPRGTWFSAIPLPSAKGEGLFLFCRCGPMPDGEHTDPQTLCVTLADMRSSTVWECVTTLAAVRPECMEFNAYSKMLEDVIRWGHADNVQFALFPNPPIASTELCRLELRVAAKSGRGERCCRHVPLCENTGCQPRERAACTGGVVLRSTLPEGGCMGSSAGRSESSTRQRDENTGRGRSRATQARRRHAQRFCSSPQREKEENPRPDGGAHGATRAKSRRRLPST